MFIQEKKNDSVELLLERSGTERLVLYIVAIAVPLFFGAMMWQIATTSMPGKFNAAVFSPGNVMWWIVIALDILVLHYAGPHSLHLNLRRGTYKASTGPLYAPKSYSGTFNDIYGLCIRPERIKRVTQYRVDLDWKVPGRTPFELGRYLTVQKAQARQQELALRMGNIPVGSEV